MFPDSFSKEPIKGLEDVVRRYVEEALKEYENGSFTFLDYRERIYPGIMQKLIPAGGIDIIWAHRIRRMQPPPHKIFVDAVLKTYEDVKILKVHESISLEDRTLFYASLKDGVLNPLTEEQQRYLLKNELF